MMNDTDFAAHTDFIARVMSEAHYKRLDWPAYVDAIMDSHAGAQLQLDGIMPEPEVRRMHKELERAVTLGLFLRLSKEFSAEALEDG